MKKGTKFIDDARDRVVNAVIFSQTSPIVCRSIAIAVVIEVHDETCFDFNL
jgi:hypothetical protein